MSEFSEDSLRCLTAYGWPGNIRELKNMVESLFLRDLPETIAPEQLPAHMREAIHQAPTVSRQEREALLAALVVSKWNKSEAAKRLHWSRMTLYRKIAKHQIGDDAASL